MTAVPMEHSRTQTSPVVSLARATELVALVAIEKPGSVYAILTLPEGPVAPVPATTSQVHLEISPHVHSAHALWRARPLAMPSLDGVFVSLVLREPSVIPVLTASTHAVTPWINACAALAKLLVLPVARLTVRYTTTITNFILIRLDVHSNLRLCQEVYGNSHTIPDSSTICMRIRILTK